MQPMNRGALPREGYWGTRFRRASHTPEKAQQLLSSLKTPQTKAMLMFFPHFFAEPNTEDQAESAILTDVLKTRS
ncbi:MAG: hypothetical protein U0903_12090 [Planctomycetales bacterium]